MPNDAHYLDIILLGKEYRVACPPDEHGSLLSAVAYVDEKMHAIAEKTKSNISERIAVMAALNIAHEHLSQKHQTITAQLTDGSETVLDIGALRRKISGMEAQLDAVLETQEKLI
jgi:cell division protein ZapA